MQSKEEQFWEWFAEHEAILYEADHNSVDIFRELNEKLGKVNSGLTFEFSTALRGKIKEFCISADGMKEHFPAVIDLVKVAPKFPNWHIKAFRQRMSNDGIVISMGDIDLSYDDIFFRHQHDGGKISLEIYARNFQDENGFIGAIFILLDALLGEYDVATQISAIGWQKLEEAEIPDLIPFPQLRNIVDRNKALKN